MSEILKEYVHWTLSLPLLQPTLGTGLITSRRPVDRFSDLQQEEWLDLQQIVKEYERALISYPAFHPNRLNYLQIEEADAKLSILVVPRYDKPRVFAGKTWLDVSYGDLPVLSGAVQDREALQALAQTLQQTMAQLVERKKSGVTILHFFRQGETDWTQEGMVEGQKDIPLSEAGTFQTFHLRKLIGLVPYHYCFASDLIRAVETAQILKKGSKRKVIPDPRLRERGFGAWEGKLFADLQRAHPSECDGIEAMESVAMRLFDFMNEIAITCPSGYRILVVTHSEVMKVLIARLLGFACLDAGIGISVGSFVKVILSEGHWRIERIENVLLPETIIFD